MSSHYERRLLAPSHDASDLRELLRRAITLALVSIAFIAPAASGLKSVGWLTSALCLVGALAVYLGLPQAQRPAGSLSYERIPAIVAPDLLAFMMCGVFIALPFWARMSDAELWSDFHLLVHPAALITWPLAAILSAIFYFSARSASFWIELKDESIRVRSMWFDRTLPYDQIDRVVPYRWGIARWLRPFAPLLVLTGRYGGAGAVLLARDSSGISLVMKDGSSTDFDTDALEHVVKKLLKELRRHRVTIE